MPLGFLHLAKSSGRENSKKPASILFIYHNAAKYLLFPQISMLIPQKNNYVVNSFCFSLFRVLIKDICRFNEKSEALSDLWLFQSFWIIVMISWTFLLSQTIAVIAVTQGVVQLGSEKLVPNIFFIVSILDDNSKIFIMC